MLNLKRFLLYSSWMKNEMFSNKSMAHVYDIAATENDYDVAIRYEKRKAIFKKLLTPYDFNNKSVLDLACGTGVFLDSIQAKQLKNVVGVDISKQMLIKAKHRLSRLNNLVLMQQSFMNLNKIPGKYDFILIGNACRFITRGEEPEFFLQIVGKLNSEGLFIITSDYLVSDNIIGKTFTKIITALGLNKNYNPKTTYTWELEKLLAENFQVLRIEKYSYWDLFVVKHKFIVCKAGKP